MTQANQPNVQVKAQANVYTALLLIAILALGTSIGFTLHKLMSPVPQGYGLKFGEIFQPVKTAEELAEDAD